MKTLEQHEREKTKIRKDLEDLNKPHPNGLECPKCKSELWDSSPEKVLMSNPPQKNIHCPKCKYRGYTLI